MNQIGVKFDVNKGGNFLKRLLIRVLKTLEEHYYKETGIEGNIKKEDYILNFHEREKLAAWLANIILECTCTAEERNDKLEAYGFVKMPVKELKSFSRWMNKCNIEKVIEETLEGFPWRSFISHRLKPAVTMNRTKRGQFKDRQEEKQEL